MHEQGSSYTYPMSTLAEFQEEVEMTSQWVKPAGFNKPMGSGDRVHKRKIKSKAVPKVRNFTHRWNEDEDRLAAEADGVDLAQG